MCWCVVSLRAPLISALDAASKLCLWKWRVSCGTKAGIQGFNLCVIVTGVENVCVAFELPDFIQTWSGDTDTLERVSYLEKSVVFKSPAAADTATLCTSKGLHTWSSSCFSTRPSTGVEADLTTVCADEKFKLERPKSTLRSVNSTRRVSEFSGKEACRVQESISILTGQTESVVGWTNSTPAWPIWSVTILNLASEVFLSSCEVVTTEFSTLKSSKTSSLAVAMASLVESSKDSFSRLNSSSFLNKSCFLDRELASANNDTFFKDSLIRADLIELLEAHDFRVECDPERDLCTELRPVKLSSTEATWDTLSSGLTLSSASHLVFFASQSRVK